MQLQSRVKGRRLQHKYYLHGDPITPHLRGLGLKVFGRHLLFEGLGVTRKPYQDTKTHHEMSVGLVWTGAPPNSQNSVRANFLGPSPCWVGYHNRPLRSLCWAPPTQQLVLGRTHLLAIFMAFGLGI